MLKVAIQKVAIQGEIGSNSHMAALEMLGEVEIVACALSVEAFERVVAGTVDGAVLPIENSLHGSVAEHYDFLMERRVRIAGESLLRIRHNLIARPGVTLEELRKVRSHPVALSQCRRWLASHREIEAEPFYDTAGSVKRLMEDGARDWAGIAPQLAAEVYGAQILATGIEDHAQNYTRFHWVVREDRFVAPADADKISLAFSLAHRSGSLVAALQKLADAGLNLTKIESRPVPGRPWEYIFYIDVRFESTIQLEGAIEGLARHCEVMKELGRYVAVK